MSTYTYLEQLVRRAEALEFTDETQWYRECYVILKDVAEADSFPEDIGGTLGSVIEAMEDRHETWVYTQEELL